MKNTGVVVLLCLQLLCVKPTLAQDPAHFKFKEEASKQEGIYNSKGEKVPAGYVISRGLAFYTSALPAGFKRSLIDLGASDRWLDIGAGMGQAMLDYHAAAGNATRPAGLEAIGKRAQSVALSIEDRRTSLWHQTAAGLEPNKLTYFFGKPLQAYTSEELGQFQVITDLLGGFSYADNLSLFLEKTLGFLKVNGSFYTILQDVHAENGANEPYYPGASFLTEIAGADGAKMKVCAWLKHVSCVRVTCELKPEWKPPVEIYHVQKVCDNVIVPALVPTHFAAGTPPERRFHLATPQTGSTP
jgi:SAM-dependent methyltransferase